jgi:chaperonin cofactor prefoldin
MESIGSKLETMKNQIVDLQTNFKSLQKEHEELKEIVQKLLNK